MRRSRISFVISVADANARSSMPLPSSRRNATGWQLGQGQPIVPAKGSSNFAGESDRGVPGTDGSNPASSRGEVVKGYEYRRGQFVTFTPEELKALDVESSKIIDLEKFLQRGDLDPVYFNNAYYLYPDGPIAVETLRVIGAAMAEAGVVGLGHLTLSRRERMVMVEPRGTGMALFTLRAADEVRASQFGSAEGDLDAEM